MHDGALHTQALARAAGVNIQTVRYYERRGLLQAPPRTGGGYRLFPPDAVEHLRFIKTAQDLGFTLKEVQALLTLRISPSATGADVRRKVQVKLDAIDAKLDSLRRIRRALGRMVDRCPGAGPTSCCPILAAMQVQAPPSASPKAGRRRSRPTPQADGIEA